MNSVKCIFIWLSLVSQVVYAQMEIKRPWIPIAVTTSAVAIYATGGMGEYNLLPELTSEWRGPYRSEYRGWHHAGYVFAGSQIAVLGMSSLFANRHDWTTPLLVGTQAVSTSYLLGQLSKNMFPRTRPYAVLEGCSTADDCRSFWSGTSALSMTIAGFGWQYIDSYVDKKHQPWLKGALLTLGASVMTSRVLAGHHYVSDVLVGGAIGFTVGYLTASNYVIKVTPMGVVWSF
ncbi:MAG: phosphatase PAP2 family protein [Cryomorphaceae bacterium]|nr:phosphatase PAP2 family protein [Cryomorphaceae bacterium]